jgi:hypothetical protein
MNAINTNYLFRFIPSVDGNWGAIVDPVKNTFNGMIGMLQRNVR